MVRRILATLGISIDLLTREEAAALILERELMVTYRPVIVEQNNGRTITTSDATSDKEQSCRNPSAAN